MTSAPRSPRMRPQREPFSSERSRTRYGESGRSGASVGAIGRALDRGYSSQLLTSTPIILIAANVPAGSAVPCTHS